MSEIVKNSPHISGYLDWFQKEFEHTRTDGGQDILTLPYQDWFGDYFQVYVQRMEDGDLLLSDNGYFAYELDLYGMTDAERKKFKKLLNDCELEIENGEIAERVAPSVLADKLQKWVRAFMWFNGMLIAMRGF